MIFFEPEQLQEAEARVIKSHNFAASTIESSSVNETRIGQRLIEKLKRQPNARKLVQGLSQLERRAFPWLFQTDSGLIDIMSRCIAFDPTLMSTNAGWNLVVQMDPKFTNVMLEALRHPYHQNNLTDLQRVVVALDLSSEVMAEQFWKTALIKYRFREAYLEAASLKKEDALTQYLDLLFLTHADKNDWQRSKIDDVKEQFKSVEHQKKMRGLVNLKKIFPDKGFSYTKSSLFQLAISVFFENEKTQKYMKRDNPEAYSWYKQALMKNSLSSFFEIYSDNERFQFWSQYLSGMKNLQADEEDGRLFLDFGNFGIIEFAAVGNAAYVYDSEYFQQLAQKNFARSTKHIELKNKQRALHRIHHSKGWTSSARKWLYNRGIYP